MKTVIVSNETHKKLIKLKGLLESKSGIKTSIGQVVEYLVDEALEEVSKERGEKNV